MTTGYESSFYRDVDAIRKHAASIANALEVIAEVMERQARPKVKVEDLTEVRTRLLSVFRWSVPPAYVGEASSSPATPVVKVADLERALYELRD